MIRFALRRLLALVPVLFGISLAAFLSMALCPGDAAKISLMAQMGAEAPPPAAVEELRREMGLDRPLTVQYAFWVKRICRGDLGRSYQTGRSVVQELSRAFPASALLAMVSMLLTILIVIPVGITSAIKKGSLWDKSTLAGSLLLIASPNFFVAIILILFFSIRWRILPVAGFGEASSLILPSLALALSNAAISTRLMRTSALEVLGEKFITVARAKGIGERLVIWKHALRSALIPLTAYLGTQFGYLFGGAAVVESIFLWPGLGRLLVDSVRSRDLFVVQGCVLAIACSYVLINLVADLFHALLDPRVRHAAHG
jgi:ABC-type dipeptide/oligopeptide/nickel transport system permease component